MKTASRVLEPGGWRPSISHLSAGMVVPLIIFSLLPAGCATRMAVEEARRVTLEMGGTSFVPPPRRASDILSLLEQKRKSADPVKTKNEAKDGQSPLLGSDNFESYLEKGEAAQNAGRFFQAAGYLRIAAAFKEGRNHPVILRNLGNAEFAAGNFKRGIELTERSLNLQEHGGTYAAVVKLYARVGDIASAEKYRKMGVSFCRQLVGKPGWGRWPEIQIAQMEANLSDARGKFADAEIQYRKIQGYLTPSDKKRWPLSSVINDLYLARNLKNQGRLLEAEVAAREVLNEALDLGGGDSEFVASTIGDIGDILLRQGRLGEAEELVRAGLRILDEVQTSPDSLVAGASRNQLADVLTARGEYGEAMREFDRLREELRQNQFLYMRLFALNPNNILALLKTNRTAEAIEFIARALASYESLFGSRSLPAAEILGLRGIAHAQSGETEKALQDLSEALPILIESMGGRDLDFTREQRLKIIMEAHLDLLSRVRGTGFQRRFSMEASEEGFRIADALQGRALAGAVGASSARAASQDPGLADLARREQDSASQLNVLQASLADLLAAPQDEQLPQLTKDLIARIETLRKARAVLFDEIERRFPKYSDLVHPKPVTAAQVQYLVRPGEALISIYTTGNNTHVWAVPHKGEVAFASVPLGEKEMDELVVELRKALDPHPITVGDIPPLDLHLSHQLYRELLKPVEQSWKGATDLLIVAGGPLAQLPFSVLVTAPAKFDQEEGELFGKYRQVQWLIRDFSLSSYPSASSFITLRQLPEGNPGRKAFAGFGDPLFNQSQVARMMAAKRESAEPAGTGGAVSVRGVRVSATGNLDNAQIGSSTLSSLSRLPDTGEEITSMAEALGADPGLDSFLYEKASEAQVKGMDLSDRRVIAFATHALVPGDLDGLDQPALALSAPEVTGDHEDGLLTMGEIVTLKLNADWVLLSGCNTASAAGAGAEALSGLGSAFFYAGTRALLVSMWPVETTSARKLTTGLFRSHKDDRNLSRARALRKSMLDLIDDPGFKDSVSGKIIASYAHPFFWAPFIMVGEGGLP